MPIAARKTALITCDATPAEGVTSLSVRWPDDAAPDERRRRWHPKASVMVVGNDRLFADALSVALQDVGYVVPDIVEPSEEAVVVVEGEEPEIVLVEVSSSGEGLSLGARIAADCGRRTRVVVLTQAEDEQLVDRSVRMGFSGYLTRSMPTEEFVRSIETIVSGEVVVPSTEHAARGPAARGPLALLTAREREVLTLLVRGATSGDIARELSVSDNTVRTHMQNVFAKLGVRSRVQAAAVAVRHGVR
jgi:two-component system, NarL family, nitrate/nitrite response regulator NarL